jgi:small-conductance mechanosensitive channel
MLDSLERTRDAIADKLGWLPENVLGAALLIVAVLVALALHGTVRRFIRRMLRDRPSYALSLFASAEGLTRFALIILAATLVLPILPLTPEATSIIARLLLLATIGLMGWIALLAVDVGAQLYLRRFQMEAADNLLARKHVTQVRILKRAADTLVVLFTIGFALMTFEPVRQYGVSLFASAGVAGLVIGLAARPLLSNLIAGVQIAVTQPIRIDDAVVVEGETGTVEDITSTYVVIKLWDLRRLIVPLSYFIEKPFQNWTHRGSALVGAVTVQVDYTVPVERVREKVLEIVKASPLWDGQVVNLLMTEATDKGVQLRALVSAHNSGANWDLRCELREKLIAFLQAEYPLALPRSRNETVQPNATGAQPPQGPLPPTAPPDKVPT